MLFVIIYEVGTFLETIVFLVNPYFWINDEVYFSIIGMIFILKMKKYINKGLLKYIPHSYCLIQQWLQFVRKQRTP